MKEASFACSNSKNRMWLRHGKESIRLRLQQNQRDGSLSREVSTELSQNDAGTLARFLEEALSAAIASMTPLSRSTYVDFDRPDRQISCQLELSDHARIGYRDSAGYFAVTVAPRRIPALIKALKTRPARKAAAQKRHKPVFGL